MDEAQKVLAKKLLTEFAEAYARGTTRNPGLIYAGEWWKLSLKRPEITPGVAASWDRAGFSAAAALPLIERGISPQTARRAAGQVNRI